MNKPIKINTSDIRGKDSLDAYHNLVSDKIISQDKEQEKVATLLKDLSIKIGKSQKGLIKKRLKKQGVYIYGDVGRGKSMLMDLFYATSPLKKKKRVHFHSFMLNVHKRIHAFRQSSKKKKNFDPIPVVAEEIADESRLLCFDEFQVNDITDAMILSRLFGELFEHGVIVVATSNVKPERLYQHGLQRDQFLPFIDLLKHKIDIVSLDSPVDYRLQKLKSVQNLYFSPLGEEANNFLDKIFADLTNNAMPQEVVLDVDGRKLVIEEAYGDVARVTFKELCEKPLGAADYIELAREFTTILLADIPKLSKEKRNEAKRFVTLIDELYEHKVNLICTAEVPPEELYKKGDGTFEFARTVSRLHEMQSEAYIKSGHIG